MILRAKHIVCDAARSLTDATIKITGKKIKDIAPARADDGALDLGEVVIAPGFVNTHTHLLYREKIPFGGDFADWLHRAGEARRALADGRETDATQKSLADAVAAGTTCLASSEMPPICAIKGFEFPEVICLDENLTDEALAGLKYKLDGLAQRGLRGGPGPHSAFTVTAPLLRACAELAAQNNLPLSIHAGETTAEAAFLHGAHNEIRRFLLDLGALPHDWQPPDLPPVRYLAGLGVLDARTLLAHCNYVTADEIDLIAQSGASVVYCPRSSDYFGHRDHPLRYLVEKGVNVALGTDSLASCNSLSILDEIKFLARRAPQIPPAHFWRMGTAGGAAALGLKNRTGRLKPGLDADLAIIDIGGCAGKSALDKIVADEARVVATVAEGVLVFGTDEITNAIKENFDA